MRKLKFFLTLVITVLIITGCASGGKDKPKKDNWNDFQTDKKIVIGFDNTFVPMGFQDKSGKNVGFDIDLANSVFERYGIKVEWQAINWDLKETELKNGNIDKFKLELKKILLENVGIFDVSGIYKEQFYHGLMLGLVLMLKREYEITSNNFAGKGRYDLLLKPKNSERRKEGIILELKVAKADNNLSESEIYEKLEKECETALQQIEEKEYAFVLKNAGIDNILKVGVAFLGKEVEVKFEREM